MRNKKDRNKMVSPMCCSLSSFQGLSAGPAVSFTDYIYMTLLFS